MKMLKKNPVGQRRVYDIEVEDVHNFYANGINVHNCATDGGVSVIADNGSVYDSSETAGMAFVAFNDSNRLFYNDDASDQVYYADTYAADGFSDGHYDKDAAPYTLPGNVTDLTLNAIGQADGLTILAENPDTQASGMVSYVTSSFQTGWMNGDIKGAFLADTDDTDLVGGVDIVTTAFPRTLSSSGAVASVSSIEVGKFYVLEYTISASTWSGDVYLEPAVGPFPYKILAKTVGTHTYVLGPALDTQTVVLQLGGASPTGSITFDSVTVTAADADRSVNNNGLIVNGTVTRSPVATGAELVAYSGFSASNYLEQPYNSDLDFGTGDFCVMGWVKQTADAAAEVLVRQAPGSLFGSGSYWGVRTQNDGVLKMLGLSGTNNLIFGDITGAGWSFFTYVRSSGVAYTYLNGVFGASASDATNYTNTAATLKVGILAYNDVYGGDFLNGSIALLRISATAPTAEQIKKIYEDEKVLFQENAQATLYGASDAVTALAHDPVTDLLHVGTSAGRSVFSGLRRVSNTTTAVGTAISASNGMVVEE